MPIPFSRFEKIDSGRVRPASMEPTIRTVRGHAIYRRPERCPVCRGRTDLFLTGTPGINKDVWTWLRPHQACVVRDLVGRCSTREVRLDLDGDEAVPLGRVRVGSAVWGRPERLRLAIDRHRRGDFGAFGRLDDLPSDVDPWCPGAYSVATRNALALAEGRGLVWSRTPESRRGPVLIVLMALLDGGSETVVLPSSLLKPEDLDPEGVLDLPDGWLRGAWREARDRAPRSMEERTSTMRMGVLSR